MKNLTKFIVILSVLAFLLIAAGCTQQAAAPVPATPAPSVTKDEMVSFVRSAVEYAHTHSKEAACAEFSDRNGSFFRGNLYIYAYDFNGTTIAHPINKEMIGVNRLNEPDALGNPFIRELRDTALNGSGFVEFCYINPANNNTVEKKLGYVEKVDDTWWLGSGIYYGPLDAAVSSSAKTPETSLELKEYVDNAADFAKARGKAAALAAFNNKTGPFVTGNTYVYALDYNGTALALPFQPELVGTSFLDIRDAAGNPYTRTEIQLAKSGGGYVLYQYPDPSRNLANATKISYVRPVDDSYWIGTGIYTSNDRLVDAELRQFVNDAKAYALTNGREKSLAEFNNPNGSFVKGDLYIFAYDYNGTTLAWPYRPDLVGVNRLDDTDPAGTHHIRNMITTAKSGEGMVDYYSVNPKTNTTQLKISYVTDVDGTWLLGAGRYLEPGPVVLTP